MEFFHVLVILQWIVIVFDVSHSRSSNKLPIVFLFGIRTINMSYSRYLFRFFLDLVLINFLGSGIWLQYAFLLNEFLPQLDSISSEIWHLLPLLILSGRIILPTNFNFARETICFILFPFLLGSIVTDTFMGRRLLREAKTTGVIFSIQPHIGLAVALLYFLFFL